MELEIEIEKKCPVSPERKKNQIKPTIKIRSFDKTEDVETEFHQIKLRRAGPVMVVDDSLEMCHLLRFCIETEGLDVVIETKAKHALDLLLNDKIKPSLIVLDLSMPQMDGREFLKHKNNDPRSVDIPVVVFSGRAEKEDLQGVHGWVKKNGSMNSLMEIIKFYVGPVEVS